MKKNILYFCLFILFSISQQIASAQDNAKDIYQEAEQYFIDENYPAALPLYLKLDSLSKGSADINFKIGYCYLNSSTYKTKSIPYLETAIKNTSEKYTGNIKETGAPISTYYYLAKAYHLNYEFDKAIETYEKYISVLGSDSKNEKDISDARHDIETCNYGKELVKTPLKVIISNLGENVNSEYPDYSPVVSLDEETLIFTSRRKGGITDEKLPNGQYFEDIYISKYVEGVWEKAKLIDSTINTPKHEATINLSADGQKLLIYKDDNGGNIYVSELKGNEWSVPVTVEPPVNTSSWEPHACFTSDNRVLYFVSDRAGGYGGRDIYKCLRLPNGKWGAAQNLGDSINTKYDEDGIFIHPDGKQIYFSSKGHKSMGGFDIFTSKIHDENGNWSMPLNYGYPVNTTDDDVFLITNVDGKRAYFSSDKEGGFGEKDIYMIEFPEYTPRDITILIGRIANNSGKSIANNAIYIINNKTGDTTQVLTANSKTGKFGTNLPVGATYKIIYTIDGKEFYSETVDARKGGGYNVSQKDIVYPVGSESAQKDEKTDPIDHPAKDDWFNNNKDEVPETKDDVLAGKNKTNVNKENIPEGNHETLAKNKTDKEKTAADKNDNTAKDEKAIAKENNTIDPAKSNESDENGLPACNTDALYFQLNFKYNQKDFGLKLKEFNRFCDNLKRCMLANPQLIIEIESSASSVPTRKYGTNERLAEVRANTAERKVIAALAKRGIAKSQLNFAKPYKSAVQGPEYKKDAIKNRAVYEQYQYIKIRGSIK